MSRTEDSMENLNALTIITKALLDKGIDYEVTLNGSGVRIRVFDAKTDTTVGINHSDSLESALAGVLAASIAAPFDGLSIL